MYNKYTMYGVSYPLMKKIANENSITLSAQKCHIWQHCGGSMMMMIFGTIKGDCISYGALLYLTT